MIMFDAENVGINYGDYFLSFKFVSKIKFIADIKGDHTIYLKQFGIF